MIFSPNSSIGRALTKGDSKLAAKIPHFEAFDMRRRKPGEVPFRSSSLTDPHIAKLIQDAANKTGEDPKDILAKVKQHIDKVEELKQYSPILYDTIAKDVVSQAAFDLVKHADVDPKKRLNFDIPTFFKLVKMVELEHSQFFPLRAPGEVNYIFHISPILVPTDKKELMKFNGVGTAAATANGDFIFNKEFMQKLMDWAAIENLKPKGRKYKSNGGPIPDQYAYIEFLIMHELLHYSFGDFSHGSRLKQYSHKVHNWASDFRSNYMLVKNGYDQLPIGLFSDHINYDRQRSYDAMVKLVHDELKKLPKPLEDEIQDLLDNLDEHPEDEEPNGPGGDPPGTPPGTPPGGDTPDTPPGGDTPDTPPGTGGNTPPGGDTPDTPPGTGDGGDDGEDPDDGGGAGEGGKDKDKGKDKGEDKDKKGPKNKDIEDIMKDIEDKLSKREEIGDDKELKDKEKEEEKKRPKSKTSSGGGKGNIGDLKSREEEIANIRPKMNWKAMIRLMVTSSTEQIDTSYSKPSRKSLTGISVAAQVGKGALKPGEKVGELTHNKIALVIDTSGSMLHVVPTVLAEVAQLLKQVGRSKFPITLVYFADGSKWFQINLADDTAHQIQGAADVNTPPEKGKVLKGIKNLITRASTGGTVFGGTLQSGLATLASQGYNVMIFSDTDLLYGSNFTNLMSLWSGHKSNVFLVWDSLQSWRAACNQIGQIPKNMTHLPE